MVICCIPKVAATSIRSAIGVPTPPKWRSSVAEAKRSGHYVAAFVRHPLDRLVSAWANKCAPGGISQTLRSERFREGMSFLRFVRHATRAHRWERDHHLRPQSQFFLPDQVDFLGRYETLAEDWSRLAAEFGLGELPHKNRSEHKEWRAHYCEEALDLALSVYREDIQVFGYHL